MILGLGPATTSFSRVRFGAGAALGTAGAGDAPQSNAGTLRDLLARIDEAGRRLDSLDRRVDVRKLRISSPTLGQANVSSSASLNLTEASAARLASTEEINTVPTSFSPRAPAWSGGSTSDPVIGGEYDGSNGDTQLTFEVQQAGVIGVANVRIRVFDGTTRLEDIRYNEAAGTEVTLANGLTLSLGSGLVLGGDTFTVDVSASVGTSVDPDGAFDGTLNDDPEFEAGQSVTGGLFFVNGTAIGVSPSDTINIILDRINQSAAGVTAVFDSATESIRFEQQTPGATPSIVLSGDTSGFLAATKLDAATVVDGTDAQRSISMDQVGALSGVSSGTFSINGVTLSVDVGLDSLDDVLATINASAAGVTASYDQASGRVSLTRNEPGQAITLSDGSSGLFAALNVQAGTYDPSATGSEPGKRTRIKIERPGSVRRGLRDLVESLNLLYSSEFEGLAAGTSARARSEVSSSLYRVFSDSTKQFGRTRLRTEVGLQADLGAKDRGEDVLSIDASDLSDALASGAALEAFLRGDGKESKGLIRELRKTLDSLETDVREQLRQQGLSGSLVNLTA